MERISSDFKPFSVIFLCLVTGLIDASASETSGQYSSDSANLSPTIHSERKSACLICHPNLEVIDNVITQKSNVENAGRLSPVDTGLPKKQGIRNNLEVKGRIFAEEMMVATEDPDFVFAPSNELQSFEFVVDFTANNYHLPGIPSRVPFETVGGRFSIGIS